MNWSLFLTIFSVIFLAELPDKTAFATLLMSTRGRAKAVFLGVAAAFFVQCLVAIAMGSVVSLLPEKWVHLISGLLFIGFAIQTWRSQKKGAGEEVEEEAKQVDEKISFTKTVFKSFVVIFIAEWGDLTQLATASFAARYQDSLLTVFTASVFALWGVTALAVLLGHFLKHRIHHGLLTKISAGVFFIIGCYFLIEG